MNDKQIGLIIGTIVTSVIAIPAMYLIGRKSYNMGCKDGVEINQELNDIRNEFQDLLNNRK